MKQYDIEEYIDLDGKNPFQSWLLSLKDETARGKLVARIDRASFGNFGDWKAIKGAKGLYEMREHYGQGYRVFYAKVGKKIILLLAGSVKRDQKKAIAEAKENFADYRERKKKNGKDTK